MNRRIWLVLIAAVAAFAYGWAANGIALEPYYAAAVRTMAADWHAFAFGAFDPAQTITLDKLPGALWLQALSVRVFGLHTWSLVLPQVVEGVLAVLVLYRAVRRLASPAAGLVAAGLLAVSPAVVALDRGNIGDSLMILLLVLAADAVAAAVTGGSGWWLAAAAVWVGLAFQAKMIQAWLVLPALALAVLVAGAGSLARRVAVLLGAGVLTGVVSLAWMTVVSLVPAAARPYVDGSTNDSVFEQVFGYNGLGRIGDQSPLQTLAAQGLSVQVTQLPPGWARLFTGDVGRDIAWLLPLALVIAVAGAVARRSAPRTDPERVAYLMWGTWLLTFAVAFSLTSTLNAYYTATLAPAIAALVGMGAVVAWRHRGAPGVRAAAAVAGVGTAGLAVALLSGGAAPRWLLPALLLVTAVAVVLVLVAWRRPAGRLPCAALIAAGIAVVLVPFVGSVTVVLRGAGALDTPFEPVREAAVIHALFVTTEQSAARSLPALERVRAGAPDLAAAQSAAVASVLAYPSGEEVLPIGGFSGTQPTPTLDELRADVANGTFHLVFTLSSSDPRIAWIGAHCKALQSSPPPLHGYYCTPEDAA